MQYFNVIKVRAIGFVDAAGRTVDEGQHSWHCPIIQGWRHQVPDLWPAWTKGTGARTCCQTYQILVKRLFVLEQAGFNWMLAQFGAPVRPQGPRNAKALQSGDLAVPGWSPHRPQTQPGVGC